jgi:DNA-binding NarL/FixJ family response regulator
MKILAADHTGTLAHQLRPIAETLSAADADATLKLARQAAPSVVVVHGELPPEGGISLAGRLAPLAIPIVLALAAPGRETLVAALRSGVRTIVGVDDGSERLRRAIEAAQRGELFLCAGAAGPLRALLEPEQAVYHPFPQLSARERDVLTQLAAGADPARVALRLGLAPKTVRHHLARIQAKLGAADYAQAALMARSAGLSAARPRR